MVYGEVLIGLSAPSTTLPMSSEASADIIRNLGNAVAQTVDAVHGAPTRSEIVADVSKLVKAGTQAEDKLEDEVTSTSGGISTSPTAGEGSMSGGKSTGVSGT